MFFSLKRNVSNAISTGLLLIITIILVYLLRGAFILYQDYQRANRYNGYLSDVNSIIDRSDLFKEESKRLAGDFDLVKDAVKSSLQLNLSHKDVDE